LFVRLLEGAPAGDWWIFVNLEAKAQVGEGFDSTEELGVIIAASLADAGLRGGHNVGLVMAAKRMVWLHPKGQTHQRWRIFQELAQAKSGETPFREVLHLARSYLRQLPSLILVTPPAWGEWISHLLPLLQRGAVATVLLLDPLSFGGEGDLEGVLGALANLRIHHYVVGREMFDLPEMQPGKRGKWEWRVGALGRAIPLRRPKDPAWKPLT
jgi:uncharacterized protein (DUF58 family)